MHYNIYKRILILGCLWVSLILQSQDNDYRFILMHDSKDYAFFNASNASNNQNDSSNTYFNAAISTNSQLSQHVYSAQDLESQVTLAVIKSYLGPVKFQQLMTELHLKKYGVSHKELWGDSYTCGLYHERNFEKVANWINKQKHLSKEQALAIWQGYCDKRWIGNDEKIYYREQISRKYDKKELRKQQQLKSDAKVQNKNSIAKNKQEPSNKDTLQNNVTAEKNDTFSVRLITQKDRFKEYCKQYGLDPQQCVYLPHDIELVQQEYEYCRELSRQNLNHDPSEIYSKRLQAIQHTIDENFIQNWQHIELSPQAQAYLKLHELSPEIYKACYGTKLQQQVHTEVCNLFEIIAQEQSKILYKSAFLDIGTQCADASFWSNQFEAPSLAMGLLDLGSACCKLGSWVADQTALYSKAIADGVIESAVDVVHMVSHPVETITNFAQAAYFVAETLSLYNPELLLEYPEIFEPLRKERQQLICSMVSAGIDNFNNSDGPERIKITTKFVSDCIFQHKALQAFGAVAGVLRTQVRSMRAIEFVSDVVEHELVYAGVAEKIVQAAEELEIVVQKSAVDEILNLSAKSENAICKNSIQSSVKGFSEELALITQQNITQNIKNIMKRSLSEIKELAAKYSKISIEMEGFLQDMLIDIEHIFIPEVKPRWKYDPIVQRRTLDEFFISGWHHGYLEQFEQAGLFKITKKVLKNDCIYVEYSWDYGKKIMKKTLFPDHWTKQQIIEKMIEVIKKPLSCIDNSIGDRLEKTFLGITSEGIEIELVLTKEVGQKNWQMVTGFVSKDYILKG